MTNKQKIKQAEKLIREVLISELEIENINDCSLLLIKDDVVNAIVNHWYVLRESEIFMNEQGVELDEFLNIEEYKY